MSKKITHSNLSKARAALILNQPFFASILLPMPISEDTSIPTMATDGETIRYNSQWTDSLTLDEITFVLAHETLHCVFDHMSRRGSRTPNRWNQAADYIINDLLVRERIGSMPKGGLYDPSLVAQGKGTAEGVYSLIPEDAEKKNAGDEGGALDHVHDSGSNQGTQPVDEATRKEKSEQIKVRVIQAKNAAKMQGKLSTGLERLVDDLLKPKVDWKDALRRFVSERAKVEPTWARPKRRFLSQDLYLPSLGGEKLGNIVVAVDCSGSVSPTLLTEFSTEINALRDDLKPSGLDVIYFDSEVCGVESFKDDEPLELKPHGGGGTAYSPVFEYIDNMSVEPAVVVFLTDLYCDDFGQKPNYSVLWCTLESRSNGNMDVPFGEILEISESEG